MEIRELKTIDEMISHLSVMQELYPSLTEIQYYEMLSEMIPNNYGQIAVFENDGDAE